MLHALNHSRPPSYRSHVSDHPVIESAAGHATSHHNTVTQPLNNNNNTTTTTSSSTINHNLTTSASTMSVQREQIQIAEVHAAPPGSPESSPSVVLDNSQNNLNNPANQRSPGHTSMISREILSPVSGQDVSIVAVSSHHRNHSNSVVFEGKTDLHQEQYQYHVKSEKDLDPCSTHPKETENDTDHVPDLYDRLFNQENQEKRSVVTIVQTSATNSEPVIVTVSGSLEQRLNTTSSDSGSDFSEIRASPAEVEILATL